jgi:hypothetical protein
MPDDARSGPPGSEEAQGRDRRLATVAAAVKSTSAVRSLVGHLAALGVRTMILRGPPVQHRLLGSDCVYRSADVDILVDAVHRRTAFDVLTRTGWRFADDNGVLWRIDGAAAFSKEGITVDLHWGLHANSVSARHLRPLERALWAEASLTPEGWYEPRIEPLLVYLAVHGAASDFHKPSALTLIRAADEHATDRLTVESVAQKAHVRAAFHYALRVAAGEAATHPQTVFDGRIRSLVSGAGRRSRALLTIPVIRRVLRAVRGRRSPPV